jgi:tRNA threonylcarbamoyladenosine biosynthesis protein TsaB
VKPIFLLIDTSSFESSVAVWNGNNKSMLMERGSEKGFAERIPHRINHLLEKAGLTLKDLSAVVLNAGPGSYTGLRTGAALAKGLCFGLDIPLITLNSLLVISSKFAQNLSGDFYLLPLIDAGRMEVYTAMFNQQLDELELTAPVLVDDNFMNHYNFRKVYFMGSGALKCKEIFERKGWVFLDDDVSLASDLINPALKKFTKSEFSAIHQFDPLYLKEFVPLVKKNS